MQVPEQFTIVDMERYAYAINVRDAQPGDFVLWYRGRMFRRVVENDPHTCRIVVRHEPWKGSAQPVRSDSWSNVNLVCRLRSR